MDRPVRYGGDERGCLRASRVGFRARLPCTYAERAFVRADTTTFATGSKDTLPITPGWQCNFDNNVNSKIDVMNSYAATYDAPNGDEILYFALERNTNTGTANVAFWFLQDEVAWNPRGAPQRSRGTTRTATC